MTIPNINQSSFPKKNWPGPTRSSLVLEERACPRQGMSIFSSLLSALFSLFSPPQPLFEFFRHAFRNVPDRGYPHHHSKKNQSIHSFLFRFFSAERIACHVLRISHYVLLMTFDFQPLTPPLLIPFDSP